MTQEAEFDSITESCDTINTEIEDLPNVFSEQNLNENVLLLQQELRLQSIHNRIVLRQFLRAWLHHHRQNHQIVNNQ